MSSVVPDAGSQKLAEWKRRHAEMRNELLTLFIDKTVMWRMIRLLGHRRKVARFSGVVQTALLRAHAANASLIVRRMVDPKPGTRSLMRLLVTIARNAADLTRASYVERWPAEARNIAERRFTRMAGTRGLYLTRKTVLADQARLRDRTRSIVDYANAYIAHRGTNPAPTPSFRDLRLAIQALVRINNKYAELLGEMDTRMPVIIESWESVFYEPWLTKRRRGIRPAIIFRARNRLLHRGEIDRESLEPYLAVPVTTSPEGSLPAGETGTAIDNAPGSVSLMTRPAPWPQDRSSTP